MRTRGHNCKLQLVVKLSLIFFFFVCGYCVLLALTCFVISIRYFFLSLCWICSVAEPLSYSTSVQASLLSSLFLSFLAAMATAIEILGCDNSWKSNLSIQHTHVGTHTLTVGGHQCLDSCWCHFYWFLNKHCSWMRIRIEEGWAGQWVRTGVDRGREEWHW